MYEMKPKSLLSVFGLALILLSEPSMAESYEDGSAANGRGDYATAFQSGRAWPIKAASPLSMALVSYIP
jgi:hypothetical protein